MKTKEFRYLLFILALSNFCCSSNNIFRFSEIKVQSVKNFAAAFKNYCGLDLGSNFELNAVESSFYGNYQLALDQATKREVIAKDPSNSFSIGNGATKVQMIKLLQVKINSPSTTAEEKASAQTILDLVATPPAEEMFIGAKPVSALSYIVEKAKKHHFTLINETHYNSQHRAFTKDLLMPLWKEGYRYLALEALGYEDTGLRERGYPILATGYYIKDSNFANLVREALRIGYQLVAYETQNGSDGTLRDRDQANNIYRQTWEKDKKGKVLVHAGYSHIFEAGDSYYEPMGYQLKKLSSQEIMTIDQVQMVGLNDTLKLHPYYREASRKNELSEPTVFINSKGKVIVDPILKLGTDIQVYHPMTRFDLGRPHWIKSRKLRQVPLPPEITALEGRLLQALPQGEVEEAVPIDQFIIANGRALILPAGKYNLRIISCEGELIGKSKLEVD